METFNYEVKTNKIWVSCNSRDTAVMKRCERYSRSTEMLKKLMISSKMSFQNKLIAIKYANVFNLKLKGS